MEFRAFLSDSKDVLDETTTMNLLERQQLTLEFLVHTRFLLFIKFWLLVYEIISITWLFHLPLNLKNRCRKDKGCASKAD
jgi:hypothetical protein